jgi:hypothetical protein
VLWRSRDVVTAAPPGSQPRPLSELCSGISKVAAVKRPIRPSHLEFVHWPGAVAPGGWDGGHGLQSTSLLEAGAVELAAVPPLLPVTTALMMAGTMETPGGGSRPGGATPLLCFFNDSGTVVDVPHPAVRSSPVIALAYQPPPPPPPSFQPAPAAGARKQEKPLRGLGTVCVVTAAGDALHLTLLPSGSVVHVGSARLSAAAGGRPVDPTSQQQQQRSRTGASGAVESLPVCWVGYRQLAVAPITAGEEKLW